MALHFDLRPLSAASITRFRSLHACVTTSFHWLKFLDSASPIGLGHIDVAFGINRQSVAMRKFTHLVTRTSEA